MKEKLIVVVVMLVTSLAVVAQDKKTVTFPSKPPAVAKAGDHLRVFGNREARRLGVTFHSVRQSLKDLKAAGAIDGTEGNAELAAIVADHLSSGENRDAFAAEGFDWDSLLAFIEKLIALIMKFFVV